MKFYVLSEANHTFLKVNFYDKLQKRMQPYAFSVQPYDICVQSYAFSVQSYALTVEKSPKAYDCIRFYRTPLKNVWFIPFYRMVYGKGV